MAEQIPLGNIEDLLDIIRRERNELTVAALNELRKEQPGSFDDNMSLKIGTRTFKDFHEFDLLKIDKAYQNYSVIDLSGGAVAEATVVAYRNMIQLAERHRDTGLYRQSLSLFARSVGGVDRETSLSRVLRQEIPSRPVLSIISDVPYAAKLESLVHHGKRIGFLYYVSKLIKREFGKAVEVKFDYFAAGRLGLKGGQYLPRLQISNPGDIRGKSKRPKI